MNGGAAQFGEFIWGEVGRGDGCWTCLPEDMGRGRQDQESVLAGAHAPLQTSPLLGV